MASLDYVFQGAPPTGQGAGSIPQPGTLLAPSVGLDVTNGVGYLNAGKGWVPQVPAVLATLNFTGISATQTTQQLLAVPAHMTGLYRVSFAQKVTTIDGTSVSFGALTVQTTAADAQAVSWTPITNTAQTNNSVTTGFAQNSVNVEANGGTNITYTLTATATGGAGRFSIRIRCEYLG
jgi:hypothetical protein